MNIINVTCVISGETVREQAAALNTQHPDIRLIAMPSGFNQEGIWSALARSDVLVVDEEMLGREGFEALRMLLDCYPEVSCLVIMQGFHQDRMIWALRQGIRGVIVQADAAALLGKAIRHVNEGEVWLSRRLLEPLRNELAAQPEGDCSDVGLAPGHDWGRCH